MTFSEFGTNFAFLSTNSDTDPSINNTIISHPECLDCMLFFSILLSICFFLFLYLIMFEGHIHVTPV